MPLNWINDKGAERYKLYKPQYQWAQYNTEPPIHTKPQPDQYMTMMNLQYTDAPFAVPHKDLVWKPRPGEVTCEQYSKIPVHTEALPDNFVTVNDIHHNPTRLQVPPSAIRYIPEGVTEEYVAKKLSRQPTAADGTLPTGHGSMWHSEGGPNTSLSSPTKGGPRGNRGGPRESQEGLVPPQRARPDFVEVNSSGQQVVSTSIAANQRPSPQKSFQQQLNRVMTKDSSDQSPYPWFCGPSDPPSNVSSSPFHRGGPPPSNSGASNHLSPHQLRQSNRFQVVSPTGGMTPTDSSLERGPNSLLGGPRGGPGVLARTPSPGPSLNQVAAHHHLVPLRRK